MCTEICNGLVACAESEYSLKRMIQNNCTFTNFKFAGYATYVTFQQKFRPSRKSLVANITSMVSILDVSVLRKKSNWMLTALCSIIFIYIYIFPDIDFHSRSLEPKRKHLDTIFLSEKYSNGCEVTLDKNYQKGMKHE